MSVSTLAIASSVRVSGDRDGAATSVISSSFSARRGVARRQAQVARYPALAALVLEGGVKIRART